MNRHFLKLIDLIRFRLVMLHNFKYSIARLSISFVLVLLITSTLIIASISTYYNKLLRTQHYNNTMNVLRLFNNNLSSDLSTLDTFLFQLGIYNTEVSIINTTSDNLKYYNAKVKIYNLLTDNLVTFDNVDGLFFYSPSADDFISTTNNVSTLKCSDYIKDFLHKNRDNVFHLDGVYQRWIPYSTNGRTYLIRFLTSGNSVFGVWSSTETLFNDFDGVFASDSVLCFANENLGIMDNELFLGFNIQDPDLLNQYQIYTQPDTKTPYLVTAKPLSFSSCYIIAFIPLAHINSFMAPVYQKLLLIVALIFCTIILIAFLIKRLVDVPFFALHNTLKAIQTGDENAQIQTSNLRCIEVNSLITVLNKMICEIRDLKINIYEEKLTKSKIEFQSLRTQVSPHFLINCLQTFSTLATAPDPSGDNRYTLRKLMQTLSEHLRYALSTRHTATLKEEFSYIDNYLQLIAMRYPDCLTWKLDLSPEVENAILSPMLLLMLTENSIKHNMIMGEKLTVTLQGTLEKKEDIPYVHITHIDSGIGFTEDTLEKCNHILEHPEISETGHNIGVYNIVKSLELTYHTNADINFSNEPQKGARIDIFIPYTYTQEKVEEIQ